MIGESLASVDRGSPPIRVYLAGGIALTGPDGSSVGERAFGGRQARRLFVRLATAHAPVAAADLADDLWGPEWPPAWHVALRALMSRIRSALLSVGARSAVTSRDGTYAIALPAGTWLDLDAARDAVHRAETAWRDGYVSDACGWALAARAIATRPLLPGEDSAWLDDLRRLLVDVRLRALECLSEIWLATGDSALAARDAAEAIDVDPFRESAHRLLIRAHLTAGNNGAAARALAACRNTFERELGISPTPETIALVEHDADQARSGRSQATP